MRQTLSQIGAIAGLTLLEILRQPVCFLLSLFTVSFIGLLPFVISHTLGETQKIVLDSALAVLLMGGLVTSTYAACHSLSREIQRGTVAAVLAKPVGRAGFLLAKYLGAATYMLVYALAGSAAILVTSRTASDPYQVDIWSGGILLAAPVAGCALAGLINFFTHRPFPSSAFVCITLSVLAAAGIIGFLDAEGHAQAFGAGYRWGVLPSCALLALAILVLQAFAILLATRLEATPALVVCSVVFLGGLMSDHLFGRFAAESRVADTLWRLTPNWQHFWTADWLVADGAVPWTHVGNCAGYALLYVAGLLLIACGLFRQIEVR